jgi:hypothetical protein
LILGAFWLIVGTAAALYCLALTPLDCLVDGTRGKRLARAPRARHHSTVFMAETRCMHNGRAACPRASLFFESSNMTFNGKLT